MGTKWTVYGLLIAALCVSPTYAQMHGGGGQAGQGQPNPQMNQRQNEMENGPAADKDFLKAAMDSSMASIQLAQVAQQTSSNDLVKQFAAQMQTNQGKMLEDLKQAAGQLSVRVPDGPSKKAMKTAEKMKGLSGDAFDQAYLKEASKSLKQQDEAFKQEAKTTMSPELKNMAIADQQTVEGHLQQIAQIENSKK
jgi:putative membrane protein